MERRDCDALVLFGATGDLCFKKIYPALYHLVRRGLLTIPVIGVARQGCDVKWLAARVRDSVKASVKDPDEAVTTRLTGLLRYVDGDYNDRSTFEGLKQALGECQAAAVLPGDPAEHVRGGGRAPERHRRGAGRARRDREALRPRPGHGARAQPDAARALPRIEHLSHRPLPRQGSGAEPAVLPLRQFVPRAGVEPQLRRQRAGHHGREHRHRRARQVLRGDRRDPRRHPEPPAADRGAAHHGAAGQRRRRVAARREGEAAQGGAPGDAGGPGARPVPGLPRGAGRGGRLAGRDLRGAGARRSTRGAGAGCRSTCAPASACR